MVINEEKLEFFDNKWSFLNELPIPFVLLRGIIVIYRSFYPWIHLSMRKPEKEISFHEFLEYCFDLLKLKITNYEINTYLK